jgi:oligopeptide/dipeptide ABC transporter ATP-binding protein
MLRIEDLSVAFDTAEGPVHAVDGVSLVVGSGRTLAVVGESGSGKTVTALAAMGLLDGTEARILAGTVEVAGTPFFPTAEESMRQRRGSDIAMIFQEPMTALNPVLTVGEQVAEPLVFHRDHSWAAAMAQARRLLERVQIPDAAAALKKYPHEMSGGQRQRVMIAMAIACGPRVLIADEPTTALDVTIQAQVLRLLRQLQREDAMALMLITHDFGVVAEVADEVAVMYAGRIVETGTVADVITRPEHPYTQALIEVTRLPAGRDSGIPLAEIGGMVPTLRSVEAGCTFRQRCPIARPSCAAARPRLKALSPTHQVACGVRLP